MKTKEKLCERNARPCRTHSPQNMDKDLLVAEAPPEVLEILAQADPATAPPLRLLVLQSPLGRSSKEKNLNVFTSDESY